LLFDRLRSCNKYDSNQNMKCTDKSSAMISKLRKQIELIGIEINGLNEQAETGRFELKTKLINRTIVTRIRPILEVVL
jgi:hypothetical protein